MALKQFPQMVYKAGGQRKIVADAAGLDAARTDGWQERPVVDAPVVEAEPEPVVEEATVNDIAPRKRGRPRKDPA